MKTKDTPIAAQLKTSREKLIQNFLKTGRGNFTEKYTAILDDYFYRCFEQSVVGPRMDIIRKPFSIIALGGYGRREQCIASDIDLLFLFNDQVHQEAEGLIHEMIYPLWDLGLEVGYATRSIDECIQLAKEKIDILIPILDARFIAGASSLYTALLEQFRTKIVSGRSKKIISSIMKINRERHSHFGDSTYLLEPNLKEGQGGLRDYHTMLWLARINSDLKEPKDLIYHGYLSHDEFHSLQKTLDFIRLVRNHVHYLTSRKSDQLYFNAQQKLAVTLKYREQKGQLAVEQFMGELHGKMEFIKQHHLIFIGEMGFTHDLKPKRKSPPKQTTVPGLVVVENMLGFYSPKVIVKSPNLLILIFKESGHLKIPLNSEAQRLVKEFSFLVNNVFRRDPENIKVFENILVTRVDAFNVLNAMLNTGFLTRFIPELSQIVNRIQYDAYHLYPVDRHSLRTVRNIKDFSLQDNTSTGELCRSLYKSLYSRKRLLLWAALLHDIGKGEDGKGHSVRGAKIVKKVLKRAGMSDQQIDTVSFLVREHLYLIKTATRRDINNEETAITCARKIKDVNRLKMLYLLSVGDAISTGPKAWNDWTATLLRDLFFKVLKILEKGELATTQVVTEIKKKKYDLVMTLKDRQERQSFKEIVSILSPRYLLYTEADDILSHIQLYQTLQDKPFVWKITESEESDTRTVVVCAKDRPGLFARISGVLTLNKLDILNAQAYTWHNKTALSIFTVNPPPDRIFENEKWQRAKNHLEAALNGNLDLQKALDNKIKEEKPRTFPLPRRPIRVEVDNQESSFFTIIEVFANDFMGLLFRITDTLYKKELDVHVAMIATKVDQVVDIFYVRNFYGEKVDSPEDVESIKSNIKAALQGHGVY